MTELSAVLTLAHRDLIKLLRDRTRIVADFSFPLIFIGILGPTLQAGFGDAATGKMDFWVTSATPERPPHKPGIHIAFRVETRALVDAFYKAALAAGGTDNGAPGIRAHYHQNYYGAFVRDPDGHNIEAVCHAPT